MWMAALYAVGAMAVTAMEAPKLWKARRTKELWIFAALLLAVTALGVTAGLYERIPNPLDGIAVVIGPFARAIYSLFE